MNSSASMEGVPNASVEEGKLTRTGMALSRVDTPTQQTHHPGLSNKENRDMVMRSGEEETVMGRGVTFQDLLACGLTMDEVEELEASHGSLIH